MKIWNNWTKGILAGGAILAVLQNPTLRDYLINKFFTVSNSLEEKYAGEKKEDSATLSGRISENNLFVPLPKKDETTPVKIIDNNQFSVSYEISKSQSLSNQEGLESLINSLLLVSDLTDKFNSPKEFILGNEDFTYFFSNPFIAHAGNNSYAKIKIIDNQLAGGELPFNLTYLGVAFYDYLLSQNKNGNADIFQVFFPSVEINKFKFEDKKSSFTGKDLSAVIFNHHEIMSVLINYNFISKDSSLENTSYKDALKDYVKLLWKYNRRIQTDVFLLNRSGEFSKYDYEEFSNRLFYLQEELKR